MLVWREWASQPLSTAQLYTQACQSFWIFEFLWNKVMGSVVTVTKLDFSPTFKVERENEAQLDFYLEKWVIF